MTSYLQSEKTRPFNAGQYLLFLDYCPAKHHALITLISEGLRRRLISPVDICRFLDIGAGTGELMEGVLSSFLTGNTGNLLGKVPREVIYIEPDPEMFRALAKQITSPSGVGVESTRKNLLLAEYDPTHNEILTSNAPYQFILASHVFYYLKDWALTLRLLMNSLSSGGVLCIVMKSKDTDLYRLRSSLPWPSETNGFLSYQPFAESLEPILNECGCDYQKETFSIEFNIADDLFTSSRHDDLRGLFEFLYMIPTNYWTTKVLDELSAGVKTIIDRNPNRSLTYKEAIFWIQSKNSL